MAYLRHKFASDVLCKLMNNVSIEVTRGFNLSNHDGECLSWAELLAADIRAAKLVARRLQGAHGQSVVHLEMVAQPFVHYELSSLKWNWAQI